MYNLPRDQRGLKAPNDLFVFFADYGEMKIRLINQLLEAWLTK